MKNEALEYWRAVKKGKEQAAIEKSKSKPQKTNLPIEVIKKGNTENFFMGIKQIGSTMLLVGIPGDTATGFRRRKEIQKRIEKFTSPAKRSQIKKVNLIKLKKRSYLGNAYLLRLFEKGSALKGQPPRSVLKASLFQKSTKAKISELLAEAANEQANGRLEHAKQILKKVGVFASQAARNWFVNPENSWSPNAPSTVRAKGKDEPGIWSATMRAAITYVLRDEGGE